MIIFICLLIEIIYFMQKEKQNYVLTVAAAVLVWKSLIFAQFKENWITFE